MEHILLDLEYTQIPPQSIVLFSTMSIGFILCLVRYMPLDIVAIERIPNLCLGHSTSFLIFYSDNKLNQLVYNGQGKERR
jgi:hypothetical protein